mmetsp:Transcript_44568/g.32665  ORF Transcript_44568/g.32665 Transcript_44568/m.32665 type:complete len:112 (+) Transcript_44568:665-1000(+)
MKEDLQIIAEKAHSLKQSSATLKSESINKMLKVYYLQTKINNIAKLNEKLRQLAILNKSVPIIQSLIENGSNFEVVQEIISNASDLNEGKLQSLKLSKVYKQKLKEYSFKC